MSLIINNKLKSCFKMDKQLKTDNTNGNSNRKHNFKKPN